MESLNTSLNQDYGLGAYLRSPMGAKWSVRSGSAYGNLENFHRKSISTNDFPPYVGDAFILFVPTYQLATKSVPSKNFPNGRIKKPPSSFNPSPLDVNLATVLLALLVSLVVSNRRNSGSARCQLRIRRLDVFLGDLLGGGTEQGELR